MTTATITPITQIEATCQSLAAERSRLRDTVAELEDKIRAIKRQFSHRIKHQAGKVAALHNALVALVENNPSAFTSPRTQIFHSICVGYRKSIGGITWDDDNQVIKLIRARMPEAADTLIKTTEKPIKAALKTLPVADLKRIGCRVEDTDDTVVVRPIDSEIDKLVDAILAEIQTETSNPETT